MNDSLAKAPSGAATPRRRDPAEVASAWLSVLAVAGMLCGAMVIVVDVLLRWLAGSAVVALNEVMAQVFAMAVALTLRFIPALSARADHLAEAYRMRSPRRLSWRIVPPLALGALDEADQAAEAMRARAHTI